MALPAIGAQAPDFTLPSTDGSSITLSGLRGRPVLLAFFPLAFTGTCTAEMCEFSDNYDAYASRGVLVLPISVDSVPTLNAFKTQHAIKVAMLSDFHREVARLYGVLDENHFFARRAYILIDSSGRINWAYQEAELSQKRDTAELLTRLDGLG